MSLIKYPYTDLHSINLDWIIEEVKKCYSPENPPDMAVLSVNGMTGDVTLYTDPAAVFPEIEGTTWSLGRTAAGTLVGIKFNKTLPLQRMNGTSLFNIYDEGNPPPYPVTSVNGRTGAVSVQEAFFSLTGDTITFITDSPDHSWSLDRATVDGSISLRLDTTNDTPAAYLEYVSDDETITRTIKLLTPDDIPSSSGVVSVNGEAGVVTLTGDDIAKEEGSAVTVASTLNTLGDDIENITDKIGNTAMGTQATTITGAIKEHSTAIGSANTNITNINNKLGNVGSTPVQDQIDTLNSKMTNLVVEFGSDSKELTQNLTDNWRTAVPNDSRVYFVRINSMYGAFYGVICRYSDVYGTGIVSRYDGRVYRIQMNNGSCSSYQLQNRPIQVLSTGSKTISGNGNISYTFENKVLVLGVYSTNSDIVCSAYPSSGADSSGSAEWWIHCRNANSSGSVASGTITCYIIYIDMA